MGTATPDADNVNAPDVVAENTYRDALGDVDLLWVAEEDEGDPDTESEPCEPPPGHDQPPAEMEDVDWDKIAERLYAADAAVAFDAIPFGGSSAAPACRSALTQATALSPARPRASDGILPSAAHMRANPTSDHTYGNAFDITHSAAFSCAYWAEQLRQRCAEGTETRVKYVIFNGRICSGTYASTRWTWRKYGGSNSHSHHMHVSIKSGSRGDVRPWWVPAVTARPRPVLKPPPAAPGARRRPTLWRKQPGRVIVPHIQLVQRYLGVARPGQPGYGVFGSHTEDAVIRYQKMRRLTADGIVGPSTWTAMGLYYY